MLKVDYSSSDTYYSCPTKYLLHHVQGWESTYGSTALRAGSTFHAGMEGYYSYVKEHGWERDGRAVAQMLEFAAAEWAKESEGRIFYNDYRTFENVVHVLTQYIDHFYDDHGFLEVLHTERAFKLLMKPTPIELLLYPHLKPFYFTGKIDLEAKLSGMNWTNEFKTTGWRLDQVISELQRSPQVIGYAYAKNFVYHEPPEGCLVTVAFFSASKLKSGDYGKLRVDFRRPAQIYGPDDLTKWREHFISLVSQMQISKELNYYPPRFQNCNNQYGRCGFLNICEQHGPVSKASYNGYVQKEPWDVTKEVAPEALMEAEE